MTTEVRAAHLNGLYLIGATVVGVVVGAVVSWITARGDAPQPSVSELRAIPQEVNQKGDEVDRDGRIIPASLRLPPSATDEITSFSVTVYNPTDSAVWLNHGTYTPRSRQTRWYWSMALESFPLNDHGDEIPVPIGAESDPVSFPIDMEIPAHQSRRIALWFRPSPPEIPKFGGSHPAMRPEDIAWVQRIVGSLEFSHRSGKIDAGDLTLIAHSPMPTLDQIARWQKRSE